MSLSAHPLALQVLTGCGIAYGLGLDQRFIAAVPEDLRGQAMTLLTAGLMTAQGLGMALADAAAEIFPVRHVIAGAGAVGLVCVCVVIRTARASRTASVEGTQVGRKA